MQVFSKEWFNKYQKQLLWLLNTPIIKIWFRWVMRIRLCDCKLSEKINRIEPNAFWKNAKYIVDKVEVTADFRSNEKFARRLYFAFKPLWHLLHLFDMFFANQWVPKLNLGFDTLTKYPVPGTTVDGEVGRAGNSSWSDLVTGAGTRNEYSSAGINFILIKSYTTENVWSAITRYICLFDTSALTSSASISAAVLSLKGTAKENDLGISPNIDIYTSTPESNTALANSDYGNIGTTSQTGSPISYADWSTSGYNAFTFNSTGRGNISKTGISKFGARNATYDAANSSPGSYTTGYDCKLSGNSASATGTSTDPKLVITYSIGNPGAFFQLF